MKGGTLFSGIGAPECAAPRLDWRWCAEIDPFASAVHAARFPDVPNLGDVTEVDWHAVEPVDLVVGGPPCQGFSVAGQRGGLADPRGNLSLAYVRALDAIDPAACLTENVPGWLSMADNSFGHFLGMLVGADAALVPARGQRWTDSGLASGPRRTAAWRILDAQFHGVPQRRRRVFVLAVRGAGNWGCAEALFPLQQGVPRNFAPRREAGQAAPTLPSRSTAGGGLGTDFDCDGGLIGIPDPAYAIAGFDASGAGRGTPIIPILEVGKRTNGDGYRDGDGLGNDGDPMFTLQSGAQHGVMTLAIRGRDDSHDLEYRDDGIANAVLAPGGGRGGAGCGAVAFHENQRAETTISDTAGSSLRNALHAGEAGAAAPLDRRSGVMSVRRLTPRICECERLQGFPNNWTAIAWRGKPAPPDGPRYRALGNSMAVPVARWILQRIGAMP